MNNLYRSVKWRALKRLTPLALASNGPEKFIVSTSDLCIGETLYITGEFDFHKFMWVMEIFKAEGKRPETLIDVGANIGPICIPAVARGYVAKAIAIEPEPNNLRLLRANVALNGLEDRVTIHASAAGPEDGKTVILELCKDNAGDHRVSTDEKGRGEGVSVPSSTLDTLCLDATNPLIWMDTQGYEGFVLAGAARLLKAKPPVVAEFWPHGLKRSGSFEPFCSALAHYNDFIDLRSNTRRPIGELPVLYDEIGQDPRFGTDILAV